MKGNVSNTTKMQTYYKVAVIYYKLKVGDFIGPTILKGYVF